MQEVTLKINSLKLKTEELLHKYKSIEEENKSLIKKVVLLEEIISSIETNKYSKKTTEELKVIVGESIKDIEEVIKILS